MYSENLRRLVLEWSEDRVLHPDHTERALRIAGLVPQPSDWRTFVRALLLWVGVIVAASGVIFFIAYNWQAMGRFFQFGLIEALLLSVVLLAWKLGVQSAAGQAAITGSALLTGALLAFMGQTYQTGADTFELFGIWALLILPWVAVARFAGLWLLWIALIETAIGLYFGRFGLLDGSIWFGRSYPVYVLFGFHVASLVAWEFARRAGFEWLQRWGALVLAAFGCALATFLGVSGVTGMESAGSLALPLYLLWMAGVYAYYRHVSLDVFPLSCWMLSAIVVITSFLAKHIATGGAGGIFVIGFVVLALSGAGAWWIRQIQQERQV